MEKLNYKQAYDKIIDAYFKDEIQPYEYEFCFCGTLCGNSGEWTYNSIRNLNLPYTYEEFGKMEKALFSPFPKIKWCYNGEIDDKYLYGIEGLKDFENRLFLGMCAALEVLKEIHLNRGENVDEEIPFKKRELLKV